MSVPACTDEEFVAMFERIGPAETARALGVLLRSVYARRASLEKKLDRKIISPTPARNHLVRRSESHYPARFPIKIYSGVVLVGSDAHYWPGEETCAHRAFVHFSREMAGDIKLVCLNGDVFDGARVSRHPKIGWSKTPTVKEELEAVEQRTTEIEDAAKGSALIWTIGNHDSRFENRLSQQTPEFEDVPGFSLKERFPRWKMVMSAWVNENTVIKHRWKGGLHATLNNTLWAGKSMITGHLHSLRVTPLSDYSGTRFGIDTGTLAEPYGEQFEYTEDNPVNWRSGFIVLTFHRGMLLWPEIVHVLNETEVEFRGQVIEV